MAVTKSQGPLEMLRQGVALYRRAFGLLTIELVALESVNLLAFMLLTSTHILPTRAPMPTMTRLPVALFFWGFGVVEFALQTGLMRSLANVADGRDARVTDLLWGVKRGEVWLLAIVLQVVSLVIFQVVAWFGVASGVHATGNPHHPIALLAGPWLPLLFLFGAIAVLGIFGNTVAMAMAMAARYTLPAFAALRAALKTFRRGYRRYLLLNFAGIGALMGMALAFAVIFTILLVLVRFLGAGLIIHVVTAIVFLAVLCVALIAMLMWVVVLLAAFVITSGVVGPADKP
ncbi:hypothetical protein [Acidiferrobacter sp.]|uniref:hypothetical protein n=1 Tax=Acidiferrobacter sp. TaxID=1872107 RepID=UPI0026049484|nr:hypothetical protein [Acidiferrobacter sp.]